MKEPNTSAAPESRHREGCPGGFHFGSCLAVIKGAPCCTKPVGCTMTHEGCLFRNHRWKRKVLGDRHPLAGEPTDE